MKAVAALPPPHRRRGEDGVVEAVGPLLDGVGAGEARVPLPGVDHVARGVVLPGLHHTVVAAAVHLVQARHVAGEIGVAVAHLPGGPERPVDARQVVAGPGVGPGAGAAADAVLDDRRELARAVGEALAAPVGEGDRGELAGGVGADLGVAVLVRGAEPEPAAVERLDAAVEVMELPAGAGAVELAVLVGGGRRAIDAAREAGELAEGGIAGDQPDVGVVAGHRVDHDALGVVVRPVAAERRSPGGGAGKAGAAGPTGRVAQGGAGTAARRAGGSVRAAAGGAGALGRAGPLLRRRTSQHRGGDGEIEAVVVGELAAPARAGRVGEAGAAAGGGAQGIGAEGIRCAGAGQPRLLDIGVDLVGGEVLAEAGVAARGEGSGRRRDIEPDHVEGVVGEATRVVLVPRRDHRHHHAHGEHAAALRQHVEGRARDGGNLAVVEGAAGPGFDDVGRRAHAHRQIGARASAAAWASRFAPRRARASRKTAGSLPLSQICADTAASRRLRPPPVREGARNLLGRFSLWDTRLPSNPKENRT